MNIVDIKYLWEVLEKKVTVHEASTLQPVEFNEALLLTLCLRTLMDHSFLIFFFLFKIE